VNWAKRRILPGTLCRRIVSNFQKNKKRWRRILGHNKMPDEVQPQDRLLTSRGGGIDDILRISVWRNPNGNRNVPCLNWNSSERNLNLN